MATNVNIFVPTFTDAEGNLLTLDKAIREAVRSNLQAKADKQKIEKRAESQSNQSSGSGRNSSKLLQDPGAIRKKKPPPLTAGTGASTPEEDEADNSNGPAGVGYLDISVIDEDDGSASFGGSAARDSLWNDYREAYPYNTFVLLVPTGTQGYEGISVPSNFYQTKSYKFSVGRNDSGGFTNWFNLMQNNGINVLSVQAIHLLVDNSGSMTIDTVISDMQNFLSNTTGVKYVASRSWQSMEPYENWIQMHITADRLSLQ